MGGHHLGGDPFTTTNSETRSHEITLTRSFVYLFIALFRCRTIDDTVGNGMTFAIGSQAGGTGEAYNDVLGLGTISGAFVAVEFDISKNDEVGDPNDNHIGLDVNTAMSTVTAVPAFQMSSKVPFMVWVDYDGATSSLQVFMAQNSSTKPTAPTLSAAWNITSTLNPGSANAGYLMGFTSATGDATAQINVMSWCYTVGG